MPKNGKWMPGSRTAQLAMAKNWEEVLSGVAAGWGIPPAEVTAFGDRIREAQNILASAMSAERTAVITAQCKAYFDALTTKMRFLKERYFLVPPLTEADLVSLGLKPKKKTRSPVPKPKNQPGIEITKWAPHTLGFKLFVAAVLDETEAEYGIRVHYGLVETGAASTGAQPNSTRLSGNASLLSGPPQTPEDLPDSFFTKRKNDLLELPPIASGKTCYLAPCYENGKGNVGPFGTMIQAIVP
jgi:hypothetical protein